MCKISWSNSKKRREEFPGTQFWAFNLNQPVPVGVSVLVHGNESFFTVSHARTGRLHSLLGSYAAKKFVLKGLFVVGAVNTAPAHALECSNNTPEVSIAPSGDGVTAFFRVSFFYRRGHKCRISRLCTCSIANHSARRRQGGMNRHVVPTGH